VPDLVLSNVSKHFEATRALDDFSLEVDRGELLVLVGPSGCGKTTALRLIAGFDAPSRGHVQLDGKDLSGVPPERRSVGLVFQHYALFPHMDVATNVAYGLKFVAPRIDAHARVAELLELVGLSGLERRRPDELSAGQRQRVALARSLAPQPKVLLLDEPLSALDVQLRQRLRADIRSIIKSSGTTALYVTHDQEEALAIADRVAVMRAGVLEQVDVPHTVYTRPHTAFVAQFVGGGNVFQARVLASDEQRLTLQFGTSSAHFPPQPHHEKGTTVRVLVRPEQLSLGGDGAVQLRGVLLSKEYLGPTLRLRLDCEGHPLWVSCAGRVEPATAPGEAVSVGFSPRHAWVLPT